MNLDRIKEKKSINELLEFGIINFDKPAGMTSFDVCDYVRKRLKLRKTSHFGTLDPMVTGVLPIALNRAVKLSGFFIGEDKEYIGTMRIHEDVSLEEIQKAINEKFLGKIMQKPPVKSRVKRQLRDREIKKFVLLKKEKNDIFFETEVQGGTYIRKLISDLGEYMGIGMHMLELRRTRAGIFHIKDAVKLEDIEDNKKLKNKIIPAEIISEIYPAVEVKSEAVERLLHGSPLHNEFLEKKPEFEKGKIISVFAENRFIGMYKVINENNIFAKGEFVLQEIKE